MPLSPLQKRITELSAKVVETEDLEELRWVAAQLQIALKEQVAFLRGMVDEAKTTIAQLSPKSRLPRGKAQRRAS